jgi:tRNA pseudouridine55 synthase
MTDYNEGTAILIDKPITWTSFDVVNKLRYALKIKKIGHAGTLDPLATGLLILCTGKWTKRIEEFQAQEKEYVGEMILGKSTPSYDSETEPDNEFTIEHIDNELIKNTVPQFIGMVTQIPPIYSAVKVNGKRLYELARKGKTTDIPERIVEIKSFEILAIDLPKITFKVVCSKGTYIRTLVHDFGKAMQSGAYMSALRRTRIGEFKIENAYQLQAFLDELKEKQNLE